MHVYGLVGQAEEGKWSEAQLIHKLAYCPKAHVFLLYYTESFNKSVYHFVAVIFTNICF